MEVVRKPGLGKLVVFSYLVSFIYFFYKHVFGFFFAYGFGLHFSFTAYFFLLVSLLICFFSLKFLTYIIF